MPPGRDARNNVDAQHHFTELSNRRVPANSSEQQMNPCSWSHTEEPGELLSVPLFYLLSCLVLVTAIGGKVKKPKETSAVLQV